MYQIVNQPQYIYLDGSSNLLRVLKVMIYVLTAVSAVFLIIDVIVIATSFDPSFILPFILALFVFAVKIMDIVGLYMILVGGERYRIVANIIVAVGLVIISLTVLVIAVEIIGLSKNILSVITNPFIVYFMLLITTDVIALIHSNTTSLDTMDLRLVKPYWVKPPQEQAVYMTELCQFPYVPRSNFQ